MKSQKVKLNDQKRLYIYIYIYLFLTIFVCLSFFISLFVFLSLFLSFFISILFLFSFSLLVQRLSYKCVHVCIHVQHSCTYTYFYKICVHIFPFKKIYYHKKVWWIGVTDLFDGSDESYEDTIIHKKASNL